MPTDAGRPRVAPLEPPFEPDAAAALEVLGPPIQLFRVFARRPELVAGIAGWGRYYLSRKSALTVRQRELVINRTTAVCGADYEWGVHIATFADKAGLGMSQIRSLASGGYEDPCWTDPGERALLRAVDELHSTSDLADDSWSDLLEAVGEDGAVELTLVAGWYHAISFTVRALRLPLEPGTAAISG